MFSVKAYHTDSKDAEQRCAGRSHLWIHGRCNKPLEGKCFLFTPFFKILRQHHSCFTEDRILYALATIATSGARWTVKTDTPADFSAAFALHTSARLWHSRAHDDDIANFYCFYVSLRYLHKQRHPIMNSCPQVLRPESEAPPRRAQDADENRCGRQLIFIYLKP